MKHLGDITKINGYEVPIVDIITGGSPCQDLSVAGKRAGLAGERSGLFMEQIRIIKEMREKERQSGKATNDIRPRYMVWENVPGAFSSNQGEDFRAVLEETVKVVEEGIYIPECPKGKWLPSGCILGDSWSVAWRVHDAQFWGVPQRRKRISLVADFNGHTAPEILFEREGLSRDSSESKSKEQGTSTDVKGSVGKAISFQERGGKPGGGKGILIQDEHIGAMKTNQNQYVCSGFPLGFRTENTKLYEEKGTTLCNGTRPGFTCGVVSTSHGGFMVNADDSNISHTLQATDYKDPQIVAYKNTDTYQKVTGTLDCCIAKGTSNQLANNNMFIANSAVVRRLTPLECERLQGFPVVREVRFTEMTKDEYIAYNINEGHIIVDTENGKVYATRGPGGIELSEPKELKGTLLNDYLIVSIRNGETKLQCRIHRVVWIAAHGIIPEGYVIDHINNNKSDNRLCNLQILTPGENSTKAKEDGLYLIHDENPAAKITNEVHDLIQYVYGNSELSLRDLSDIFGISKSRVGQIIYEEPWTDIGDWVDSNGKKHKGDADAPRYKALGNSIALPYWKWLAERMCKYLDKPTMASLFDGIGGFALVYKESGCEPVWASEVEDFCIAVTKKRFGEE